MIMRIEYDQNIFVVHNEETQRRIFSFLMNQKRKKETPSSYRRWTQEEDDTLRNYLDEGMRVEDIAPLLNRSMQSITMRIANIETKKAKVQTKITSNIPSPEEIIL